MSSRLRSAPPMANPLFGMSQRFLLTGSLVGGMLLAGTINTLLSKYQDMVCISNCSSPDVEKRILFEQPVWQTLNMFLGESLCLLIFYSSKFLAHRRRTRNLYVRIPSPHSILSNSITSTLIPSHSLHSPLISPTSGNSHSVTSPLLPLNPTLSKAVQTRNRRVVGDVEDVGVPTRKESLKGARILLLWVPTLCDMTASTLMNVGLIFTSASIYQMLRGAVVVFTFFFSKLLLKTSHPTYRYLALLGVVSGISLVGLAGILFPDQTSAAQASASFLGVLLTLFAQAFTALQFVLEEIILSRYSVTPLKAAGCEGFFGVITTLVAMPLLYFFVGKDQSVPKWEYFNIPLGWNQVTTHSQIWVAGIFIMFSIASFNFFGLSVTRTLSSTSRSMIDTCRTFFIWMVSLALGWEKWKWLQVTGFVVLILSTMVFNDIIRLPPGVLGAPINGEEVVNSSDREDTDDDESISDKGDFSFDGSEVDENEGWDDSSEEDAALENRDQGENVLIHGEERI